MGYPLKIQNSKLIFRESDIIRQICKYLRIKREFFWRHNNVGVYSEKRKAWLKPHFGIRGVPDIFLIKNGVLCGIEVKSEIGKQSVEQATFSRMFEGGNRKYFVVRSLMDLMARLEMMNREVV